MTPELVKKRKEKKRKHPEPISPGKDIKYSPCCAWEVCTIETWFSRNVRHWTRDRFVNIHLCVLQSSVANNCRERQCLENEMRHATDTLTSPQGQHDRHVTTTVYLQSLWTQSDLLWTQTDHSEAVIEVNWNITPVWPSLHSLIDQGVFVCESWHMCACIYWISLL